MDGCCDPPLLGRECTRFFKVLPEDFQEKLYIPNMFVKNFINMTNLKTATIKIFKIGTWEVDVKSDSTGLCFTGNGWRDFVKVHSLEIGNILVFHQVDHMVFSVLVLDNNCCSREYPSSDANPKDRVTLGDGSSLNESVADEEEPNGTDARGSGCPSKLRHEDKAQQPPDYTKANLHKDTPVKPKFEVVMKSHNIDTTSCYLTLPRTFVVWNNIWGIIRGKLCSSAYECPVKLNHQYQSVNKRRSRIRSGWGNFQSRNKLKIGDVCVFELLHKDKDHVVFFMTKTRNGNSEAGKKHNPLGADCNTAEDSISASKRTAPKKESEKTDSGPNFVVTLTHHNIHGSAYMRIPRSFEGYDYLFESQHRVLLKDTQGCTWFIVIARGETKRDGLRLKGGWNKFVQDKLLEVGDICTFNLLSNGKKPEMLVQIKKKGV